MFPRHRARFPRFASWHALVTFPLALLCALSLLLGVGVAFVDASRLILGVHYPTDVAGSVILGSTWMTGLIAIYGGFSWGQTGQSANSPVRGAGADAGTAPLP